MSEALKDLNYDVDIADDNLAIKKSIEQTINDIRMDLSDLKSQIGSPENAQELEKKLHDHLTLDHVNKVLDNSLKAMKEQSPETTMSTMVENLGLGFVLSAQIWLKKCGFYDGPLNGVYRTHEQAKNKELSPFMKGVEAFQTKRNTDHPDDQITANGHANAQTLERLMTMTSETETPGKSRETMPMTPNEESGDSESTGDAEAIDVKDAGKDGIVFTAPGSTEPVTLKASKEVPDLYVQEEYGTDGVTTRYEVKMKNGTTATKAPSNVESASKITHSEVTFPDFDGDGGADGQGVIIQTKNLLDATAKPEYMLQQPGLMEVIDEDGTRHAGTIDTPIVPNEEHMLNDTQGITFSERADGSGLYISEYSVTEIDDANKEEGGDQGRIVSKTRIGLNRDGKPITKHLDISTYDKENNLESVEHQLYNNEDELAGSRTTISATTDRPSYIETTVVFGERLTTPIYSVMNNGESTHIDILPGHIATIEDQTYYVTRGQEGPSFTKLDINREVIPYTLTNGPSFKLDDVMFDEFPQTPKNLIDYSNAAIDVQFFGTPGMTQQEMADPATQGPWQKMMGLKNSMPANTYVAGQVVDNKSGKSYPLLRDTSPGNENVMYVLRTNPDGTRTPDKYNMVTNGKTGTEQAGMLIYDGNPEAMAGKTTNIVNAPKAGEKDDLKELGMLDNSAYATQYKIDTQEAEVKIQYGTGADAKNILGKNIKEGWTAVSRTDPKTLLESSAYFKFGVNETGKFALTKFSKDRPSVNTIQQLEIEKPVV